MYVFHLINASFVVPQYEVKAPMPSACFRNICKQMAKMHEAIYDLLPEEQTQVSPKVQTAEAMYCNYQVSV